MTGLVDLGAMGGAFELLTSSWQPWLVVVPGLIIGMIFGSIPGLSTSMAMAIFLPLTLHMNFLSAMLFLTAIYTGGGFSSAIPSILVNIPGNAASVATTFDGYPMARSGRHNEALGIGLMTSAMAEVMGYILLLMLIQPMAYQVLKLGPTEMFLVAIWGLLLIVSFSEKQVVRGLFAGILGLLIGTIGMSPRGDIRGTMGSFYLLDGVPGVAALIGMFAAAELFNLLKRDYIVESQDLRHPKLSRILAGMRETFRYPGTVVQGSMIGIIIGAVPGVGSSVSNLVAYAATKRRVGNKAKIKFGDGNPHGVVASESANSSSEAGSMATLLALGLPGGGITAVLLGAFAMHNITGGPRFITENTNIVYAIIFGNMAQSILLLGFGTAFLFVASSLVKIRIRFIVTSVMVLAFFGAYAITGNMMGPITVFVFSLIGWFMSKYKYPVAATVVGILLGGMVEGELLRSYQISGGSLAYAFNRPVTVVLMIFIALSIAFPIWRSFRNRIERDKPSASASSL